MKPDWKELSEAASREKDPKKLMELVDQLDQALEECEKTLKEKNQVHSESGSRDSASNLSLADPLIVPAV